MIAKYNGKLFVFARQENFEVMRCLDAATGKELWQDNGGQVGRGRGRGMGGQGYGSIVAAGAVDPGSGTSLFDKSNAFGSKHWWYFTIPIGTVIPDSLRIRHTGRNDTYQAEHYQIEAAARSMPVEAFKGALDNLARNAVVKLYENAR